MTEQRWLAFLTRAYGHVRAQAPAPERLGPCPSGPGCGTGGYDCCPPGPDPDYAPALPHEASWVDRHPAERQPGCAEGCAAFKTLLCGLWPVLPMASETEWWVKLVLNCEAFVLSAGHYVPVVRAAADIARTLQRDFPDLLPGYLEVLSKVRFTATAALDLRGETAAQMLADPAFPRLVRTLQQFRPPDLSDRARRVLPIVLG